MIIFTTNYVLEQFKGLTELHFLLKLHFDHQVRVSIGNRMNASAFRDLWARVMF